MNLDQKIKGVVRRNEPMMRHTTFKIGGPAEIFFEPRDSNDLRYGVLFACAKKKYIYSVGAGSNLLVGDNGLKGMVIKLNAPFFKRIDTRGLFVSCGAGVSIPQFTAFCIQHNLSGAEFLAGIPGTIGGALAMNAGAWGSSIEEIVENVTIMDYNGFIKVLNRNEIGFSYRSSGLSRCIVLAVGFRLRSRDSKNISSTIRNYCAERMRLQDMTAPSAGCVFKNPSSGISAGKMIDDCGLKGTRIGGAEVSRRHANFIVNTGGASAADVLKLISLIRRKVNNSFNIRLDTEIKIWKTKK
ncbi:MAG: UDP-N-acetylmuramate dehydrogenase [Candidatus Omnitrophica bacterium]|nr:UDP-N-acetylmuramate dehydrogenase [Candidatus Omnitrophota bacterium]